MVSTFCKTVTKAGSGGTKGTFSTLDSIILRADARKILGLIAVACADKLTTVEGVFQALAISGNWSYGTQYFTFGNSQGNGVANNEENFGVQALYIPMDIPVQGGETLDLTYCAYGVDVTENIDIAVGLLYANGSIPGIYGIANGLGRMGPTKGGILEAVDNATTSDVAFSAAGKTIPSWAKALVGIAAFPVQDGVAVVDDPIIAKYVFHSTAPNFEPQEFPGVVGYSGGLGTSIIGTSGKPIFHIPTYIPLPGVATTITGTSILTVANAGNVGHIYNWCYA